MADVACVVVDALLLLPLEGCETRVLREVGGPASLLESLVERFWVGFGVQEQLSCSCCCRDE